MEKYFMYILECRDGSYYTGVTNNVEKRLQEHQSGAVKGCYTHNKRPVKLVFTEGSNKILDVIEREKQIKGWSRKKKEALISRNFEKLQELSRGRTSKKDHPSTSSG